MKYCTKYFDQKPHFTSFMFRARYRERRTYCCSRHESLNKSSFLPSLFQLNHGIGSLHNLQRLHVRNEMLRSFYESFSSQLNDTSSCDTVEDDLGIERCSHELLFSFFGLPDDEEIACTCFGDLEVRSKQPQNLIVARFSTFHVSYECRAVLSSQISSAF